MWEPLLPIFGFLIGIAAALTGVGGGIFIVPLLNLLFDFSVVSAIGTSLATIIPTSIAAAINYARQKRVYFTVGILLALATSPGAYIGSELTSVPLVKTWLGPIFGVFLIIVAAHMIVEALSAKSQKICLLKDPAFEKNLFRNSKKLLVGFVLSFFGGVASGLLGVGGGSILVPIMCLALDFPIHFSVPTSMFIMIFTSITGVAGHLQQGDVNPLFALYLGAGSIIGAQIGAWTSKRLSNRDLRLVFAVMLIVASVNMILKSLKII